MPQKMLKNDKNFTKDWEYLINIPEKDQRESSSNMYSSYLYSNLNRNDNRSDRLMRNFLNDEGILSVDIDDERNEDGDDEDDDDLDDDEEMDI